MTYRRRERLSDNDNEVEEKYENKINAADALHLDSDREKIIFLQKSPKNKILRR